MYWCIFKNKIELSFSKNEMMRLHWSLILHINSCLQLRGQCPIKLGPMSSPAPFCSLPPPACPVMTALWLPVCFFYEREHFLDSCLCENWEYQRWTKKEMHTWSFLHQDRFLIYISAWLLASEFVIHLSVCLFLYLHHFP